MRVAAVLFVLTAVVIGGVWAWLGQPVAMPGVAGEGGKLYCVSYAPFRGSQSPLDPATHIEPFQIEEDIAQLAKITGCVRTYSVDFGLDRIAEIAGRHGMKVIQGLWLSSHADKNHYQVETAVALANKYSNVIASIVVGNEVLLRGEMSANDLAATLRSVKARVPVPVTYADVWEFWLRNPTLATVADFVTIHILPYWEDFPIPAQHAAEHVASIRQRVVAAFPGKDVMIGEFGWPSAGRMREGALPSPINQARTIVDVTELARREHFRVNLIEAYDQPWKRALEGTVGGHWGLIEDHPRQFKFGVGAPVSNHPAWLLQALGGDIFAALVFGAALAARRRRDFGLRTWAAIAGCACSGGVFIGWTIENIPLESLGIGGWTRSIAFAAVAASAPLLAAAVLSSETPLPQFDEVLSRQNRVGDRLALAFGTTLIVLTVLAIVAALGLVFDPRYRDFPFAPMSGAVIPFVLYGLFAPRTSGPRGTAELAAAALLALAAVYIATNESVANWQSLWFCALLALLAITLVRPRDERS